MIISPKQYKRPLYRYALCNYKDLRKFRTYQDEDKKEEVKDAIKDVDKDKGCSGDLIDSLKEKGLISESTSNYREMTKQLHTPKAVRNIKTFFEYYS